MADGPAFDIQTNLRSVLASLKEFEPKLATQVRRDLRKAGDAAIEAMGQHLDEMETTGKSRGSRDAVKSGLRMRVTTGKAKTSIRVATTDGDLRKPLNRKSWRHPVFGSEVFVEQKGSSYFTRGAAEQKQAVNAAIDAAVQVAVEAVAKHVSTTTE